MHPLCGVGGELPPTPATAEKASDTAPALCESSGAAQTITGAAPATNSLIGSDWMTRLRAKIAQPKNWNHPAIPRPP